MVRGITEGRNRIPARSIVQAASGEGAVRLAIRRAEIFFAFAGELTAGGLARTSRSIFATRGETASPRERTDVASTSGVEIARTTAFDVYNFDIGRPLTSAVVMATRTGCTELDGTRYVRGENTRDGL